MLSPPSGNRKGENSTAKHMPPVRRIPRVNSSDLKRRRLDETA
jgi:hypothetical protein